MPLGTRKALDVRHGCSSRVPDLAPAFEDRLAVAPAGLDRRLTVFVVDPDDSKASDEMTSLRDHCRDRLGAFKTPHHLKILPELPKERSGKVQRMQLKDVGWS